MSMPPNSAPTSATHRFSAGPSATSSARPVARTPVWDKAATVALTSSVLRAHIATLAPSAAKWSAIARPMPFVAPVTSAFFPARPRSMHLLLALRDEPRLRDTGADGIFWIDEVAEPHAAA